MPATTTSCRFLMMDLYQLITKLSSPGPHSVGGIKKCAPHQLGIELSAHTFCYSVAEPCRGSHGSLIATPKTRRLMVRLVDMALLWLVGMVSWWKNGFLVHFSSNSGLTLEEYPVDQSARMTRAESDCDTIPMAVVATLRWLMLAFR